MQTYAHTEIHMDHIEMVQKLHENAGVSLAEAKDVLERSDWDMLDALLLLEREGKIPPITASASTSDSDSGYEEVKASAGGKNAKNNEQLNKKLHSFSDKLRDLVLKGFTHDFVIRRRGSEIVCIPLAFLIIIAIFAFYPILVALVIGLFFDCVYSVEKRKDRSDNSN